MDKTPHTVPKFVTYLFFVLGLVSALAFRGIIVAQNVDPSWVRPVWYTGTIGYILFFLYRFHISRKRKHAIEDFRLLEKLKERGSLEDSDRQVLIYLLSSLKRSPEDINYCIIFVLSVLAILVDLWIF